MGLQSLKANAPDLGANPEMLAFVQNYTDMGFFSIILFLFIGAILTMIVQASAATMAITLIMCANGWIDYHLGLSFITEGAIPFGAADPARAIPSFILGSAVTGGLVGLVGIKLMAPHGGIFVIALTSNALLYLASVLVGAIVSGVVYGYLRKPQSVK